MAEDKPMEKKDASAYVNEHLKEEQALFAEAFEKKNAIYMCDKEDIRKMHAIQEVYASKEGEIKSASIPAPESIYLMQVMKDRGITDPRIISLNNQKKFDLNFKKGAKSVTITKFSSNKKPYTEKVAFVEELYAKKEDKSLGTKLKQSAIEVTNHRQDAYVRNMVNYLKMRNERGTLKPDNYVMMVSDAKASAHKSYETLKPLYDEETKRTEAIRAMSPETKVTQNDYVGQFQQMYKENLEKNGASRADYFTLREAIVDKKWDEKIAKNAFTKVSPNAVFDKIRKVPLVEAKLDAIKRGKYYNEHMDVEKQQAAAR